MLQWQKGSMDSHLSRLTIKALQEMVRALHSASHKVSEGFYQETSGDEVMLSSTWNCNACQGLLSPSADTSSVHAAIRKWLDLPLPEGHAHKGKGAGKEKWKGDRFLPPPLFKDSPCSSPTHFYYDVYKEMAAAELYKREVVAKQGKSFLGSYFDTYDEENPMDEDHLGDSMFESEITWREYDLVLAIKLETANYPMGH